MMHIHHVQSLADDSVLHLASPLAAIDFDVPDGYTWLYSQTEEEIKETFQECTDALRDGALF